MSQGFHIKNKGMDKVVLVQIYKGVSLADYENYINNRLIMFRLKVKIRENIKNFIPIQLEQLIEVVEHTDIDIELLETFLKSKWKKSSVMKFLSPLREVYFSAKPGDLIGELEMDFSTFKDLLRYLHILNYETFYKEDVIGVV